MRLQKRKLIKVNYEPSLKASRIRAYVEPILKLLIEIIIIDNFVKFDKSVVLIEISIINNIRIASNIVLIDLSNKKDNILFVK